MAVFFIILIPAVLLIGGLAVDISQLNAQKLFLQGQADLAAQSAAARLSDLDQARARAQETVSLNDQYGEVLLDEDDVIFGSYAPETGFDPTAPTGVNAVKVSVSMPWYAFLWSAIVPSSPNLITRSAVAMSGPPHAAFTLRNRLLTVDTDESPLLDPIADALVGENGLGVDLEAIGYAGLATTNVEINELVDLVSLGISGDVVTFDDLLNASIATADLVEALLLAAGADLSAYTAAVSSNTSLGRLLELSPSLINLNVDDPLPDLEIGLADMLTVAAGLANSDPSERLSADIALPLGPLADVHVETGLIRAPVTFVGPVSDETPLTGEISQVDLSVEAQLAGLLDLSLDLSAANATATLTELNCAASEPDDIIATFEVTSGPASLGLGLSLLAPIDGDDAAEHTTTDLASSTQTVEIRLDQVGQPVAVSSQLAASDVTSALSQTLENMRNDLHEEREETSDERYERCMRILFGIGCLLDVVVRVLDDVISQLTAVIDDLTTLLSSSLLLDGLVQALLDALGIDIARVDIILNDHTCSRSDVRLVN